MNTILVVDDNKEYREGMLEVLELSGYTAIPAENGAVALNLLRQKGADLVLSNGQMPLMTGLDLLQSMKADEQLQAIPFVMITGHTEANFAIRARDLGAAAVLSKPVQLDDLLLLVERLLSSDASVSG
jgi:CheY-like chemotaxis protein